jgi:pyruvate kinase
VISLPCLTTKDLKDLDFILKQKVNWIALSFVRKASDVRELQDIIQERGHEAKVIAKIEKPEALVNLKEIIAETNAVMIARGDLGVEVPMERVPSIQKNIIRRCIQMAKPVIVATQMMESMITNPSPSRAEITDVANAVLDGTDAVMLSGETSVGDHPVETVRAMNKIITEAERNYEVIGKKPKPSRKSKTYYSDMVCIMAARLAEEVKAVAITGVTVSGYTAFKASSYRPKSKILIFSKSHSMLCTLNLVWGVRCFHYDKFSSTDETIEDVIKILKDKGLVKVGDAIINTGAMPLYKRSRTNMMKLTLVD